MILINESDLKKISKVIDSLINGENAQLIESSGNAQSIELEILIEKINLLIQNREIITDSILTISDGDLKQDLPKSRSQIINALKSLQSHLRHLTWQAQQISTGDYNQKVDFMGDFSLAFNNMTKQLKSSFDEIKQRNRELYESEIKLKEALQTKDKFFSIIAHDLRGPIGTLMNTIQFLAENIDELSKEELYELLQLNSKSIKNTFELLENLLTWARSQKGAIEYKPEIIDLKKIVRHTLDILSDIADKKTISIITDIPEDESAFFDKDMITTVIRNLISNSIKFTPVGGSIFISTKKNDNQIEITIRDTGVGISEENLRKLFRIDQNKSTFGTQGEKGTGLGLILCREFVEKNGGEIWVESETGKGSSFIFTLPCK
jgi:signal transduction histidine kinase